MTSKLCGHIAISRTRRRLLHGILGIVLMPAAADADVNVRNGNFFVGFTDLLLTRGSTLRVQRTYNSKASHRGIFGWGWSTEYETRLDVLGDGTLRIREAGGGRDNYFRSSNQHTSVGVMIATIAQAQRAAANISDDSVRAYQSALRTNRAVRVQEWLRLRAAGLVDAPSIPDGAVFQSESAAGQSITRLREGYARTKLDGTVETFDGTGKLRDIRRPGGYRVEIGYAEQGCISALRESTGYAVHFETNASCQVTALEGDSTGKATYRYNARGELISSVDVDGNRYLYEYDESGRHNMTRIRYGDSTFMTVEYWPMALSENVKQVTGRDGAVARYHYAWSTPDSLQLQVVVTRSDTMGSSESIVRYEFLQRLAISGERWDARRSVTTKYSTVETEFDECCGRPVRIVRDSDTTAGVYNEAGLLVRKETPAEIVILDYAAGLNKVSVLKSVRKRYRQSVPITDTLVTRFGYDDRGNLVNVESGTLRLKIGHDAMGRMIELTSGDSDLLRFSYTEDSRLSRIESLGRGALNVSYNADGAIGTVEGAEGEELRRQIQRTYNTLLAIIERASKATEMR